MCPITGQGCTTQKPHGGKREQMTEYRRVFSTPRCHLGLINKQNNRGKEKLLFKYYEDYKENPEKSLNIMCTKGVTV